MARLEKLFLLLLGTSLAFLILIQIYHSYYTAAIFSIDDRPSESKRASSLLDLPHNSKLESIRQRQRQIEQNTQYDRKEDINIDDNNIDDSNIDNIIPNKSNFLGYSNSNKVAPVDLNITLLMSPKELQWIQKRNDLYVDWLNTTYHKIRMSGRQWQRTEYYSRNSDVSKITTKSNYRRDMITQLQPQSQSDPQPQDDGPLDKDGPWLDFVIVGNPKCGTTTLMANLGHLAPMPTADICTGPTQTLRLAYEEWPVLYGNNVSYGLTKSNTQLRGSKCPRNINSNLIRAFATNFPKTKFIVGIRHPVLWFTSFWRMMTGGSPYRMMQPCPCLMDERTGVRHCPDNPTYKCFTECPEQQIFCLHRARFHLPLARLGKTPLSEEERTWLAPNDLDGGHHLISWNVTNPIFLYDQTQMKESSYWDELAQFLKVSHIPNTKYHGSKGKEQSHKDLCDPQYDVFRAAMMPYSYELSIWLQTYLIPVALDPNRNDVVIPNIGQFIQVIETYKQDPCLRLIRNDMNGAYMVNPNLNTTMLPPPKPSWVMKRPKRIKAQK